MKCKIKNVRLRYSLKMKCKIKNVRLRMSATQRSCPINLSLIKDDRDILVEQADTGFLNLKVTMYGRCRSKSEFPDTNFPL